MTEITGASDLIKFGKAFEVRHARHATALKIKEIFDDVLSLVRRPYIDEFGNVHVHDVMYMANGQYSVDIIGNDGNDIIMNHELKLIDKKLSQIGLRVEWIGATSTDDIAFLRLFLTTLRGNSVCDCPACESEVFQRENK